MQTVRGVGTAGDIMTSLDISNGRAYRVTRLRGAWEWYDAIPVVRRIHKRARSDCRGWRRASRWLNSVMPKGLYARALLIIIAPMVILQSVVAFVFMERHWNVVTQRLSASVVQDIAALIDIYRGYPQDADQAQIRRIAQQRSVSWSIFCRFRRCRRLALSLSFHCWIRRWRRNCASRSGVLIGWTQSASPRAGNPRPTRQHRDAGLCQAQCGLCLQFGNLPALDGGHIDGVLAVAIIFLRNQIKPILRLADAAESFGKGREVPNFRPRGAREVRRAAAAFIEMKTRIERSIEQRTAMLAGVSHDLRTVLTRFKARARAHQKEDA